MFVLIYTRIFLSCKTFLHAHILLLSLEVNQECLILYQSQTIKYQQIEEDVGGGSVLGIKKKKKSLEFLREERD